MIKIGILEETKTPADNRAPLSPRQVKMMADEYGVRFAVQSSRHRAFADSEYREMGIDVREDISDCDTLLGVKEPSAETLIPDKHYFFFGHIAKGQPHNRLLLAAMVGKGITFTDYEYLKDGNGRVCAFGFWAGAVGAYNTIRLYGLRYRKFDMPMLHGGMTFADFKESIRNAGKKFRDCAPKIVITGNGRVSAGAIWTLGKFSVAETDKEHFGDKGNRATYIVAKHSDLIKDRSTGQYDRERAREQPERHISTFPLYAKHADILLACHYWNGKEAKHFTKELAFSAENRIRVVGDITCDINGSVETTIRPSTHAEPFYDVDANLCEAPLFANPDNISVMAVDTLPNALPRESSEHFGMQLMKTGILQDIARERESYMLDTATIIRNGRITPRYAYLR